MLPERDECIEQTYFFRTFRERLAEQVPAQEILARMPEELLTTTRLPMAVEFLATEMKHTGLLASGMKRLAHYFTAFQAFVARQAEEDGVKFSIQTALTVLEREASYKAEKPTPQGLFVFQFETISRNRLGYDEGLFACEKEPMYDAAWRNFCDLVRRQVGVYEFSDLLYARSEQYSIDERRKKPDFVPSVPPLFASQEGRIAKASHGRDPMFLFAALQRQLNYPEVPRTKPRDDTARKIEALEMRLREMESRMRMTESELRGNFDPTQFGKPDMFRDVKDDV